MVSPEGTTYYNFLIIIIIKSNYKFNDERDVMSCNDERCGWGNLKKTNSVLQKKICEKWKAHVNFEIASLKKLLNNIF